MILIDLTALLVLGNNWQGWQRFPNTNNAVRSINIILPNTNAVDVRVRAVNAAGAGPYAVRTQAGLFTPGTANRQTVTGRGGVVVRSIDR